MQPISHGRLGKPRLSAALLGAQNGVNLVFTTPQKFLHISPYFLERVYVNGQRMKEGPTFDYVASESGGPGAGFDTITFIFPPLSVDVLLVDFYEAS